MYLVFPFSSCVLSSGDIFGLCKKPKATTTTKNSNKKVNKPNYIFPSRIIILKWVVFIHGIWTIMIIRLFFLESFQQAYNFRLVVLSGTPLHLIYFAMFYLLFIRSLKITCWKLLISAWFWPKKFLESKALGLKWYFWLNDMFSKHFYEKV